MAKEYIEREAFIKNAEARYCDPCKEIGKDSNGLKCRACWVDDMVGDIEDTPAADVAEVVHGSWIPLRESEITGWNPGFAGHDPIGGYKCSNCNKEAVFDCNDSFVLSDYCPNCGAKMDGGE